MDHITTSTNSSRPAAAPSASEPDCDRVSTVLDQLTEGQSLTAEDEDYLYHHASDCSPCFEDIRKQHAFIDFLNQRLTRKASPQRLPAAIMASVVA